MAHSTSIILRHQQFRVQNKIVLILAVVECGVKIGILGPCGLGLSVQAFTRLCDSGLDFTD